MTEIHQIKYYKDKKIKYIIFSYENESFKIKMNVRKFRQFDNMIVIEKLINNMWSSCVNFEKDFNFIEPCLIVDHVTNKIKSTLLMNDEFKDDSIEDLFKKELNNITS